MRIAREDSRWRVLGFGHVVHDCLEALAYERGYRVREVCKELGLCEGYFREIFVRDVGLSPKDWMAWERMVVARRLLGWGMDPLVVAERLGFSHPNSFRREFCGTYGVTVSRFLEIRAGMWSLEGDVGTGYLHDGL